MKLLDFEKYSIGTNHGFIDFEQILEKVDLGDGKYGRDLTGDERSDAMMGCIASAVLAGRSVLVFSLRMDKTEFMQHILSVVTGIPQSKLDSGALSEEELDRLMDGARRVVAHKNSFGIVDATGVNGAEFCGRVVEYAVEFRPEFLFVDGLRSLVGTVGEGGDGGEWGKMIGRLEDIARNMEGAMIA